MYKPMRKNNPMIKIFTNSVLDLPTPSSISTWWNLGSILGMCLMIQILTGLFLAINYCPNVELAFKSIIHIYRNVNYGWLMKILHANGASLFFICLYLHIGRSMYYGLYKMKETWMVGVIILFSMMATAFMGYILPWGQMSFWGATVITNLISTIPYIGQEVVKWIWGGFAIENATLNRFFTLHFILPFMLLALMIIHLIFIHQTGSNNPIGLNSNIDKIPFHPYFSSKDILGFILTLMILIILTLFNPNMMGDPENFNYANPLVTPIHIQPEWYFLFAYAILRSIPNKLGGVIALILSIGILTIMPMTKKKFLSNKFYPMNKILFWMFLMNITLLTWMGTQPVEEPFLLLSKILTKLHFLFFIMNPVLFNLSDKILMK